MLLVILDILIQFQARNRVTGQLAAAKIIQCQNYEELQDFAVEIEILASCQHPNIINLLDAYYFESTLWVSNLTHFLLEVFNYRLSD